MPSFLNITDLQRFLSRRKLGRYLQIAASFLPWHREPVPASALKIKLQRQWTPYSCTAACSQMITAYFGREMNHFQAIKLTKCRPHGAVLKEVARAIKRGYGLRFKSLKRKADIKKALSRGEPVLSTVTVDDPRDHAVVLIGSTAKGYWIADPGIAAIYWKHERTFFKGADEFYAFSA